MLQLLGRGRWQPDASRSVVLVATRRCQLLALLGYEADWVPRERVAAMFWPERPASAARANLRKVLHELRAMGVQGLEESPAGLRW